MLYLFTGQGKGKTTSSLGQCLRVVGQGGRVAVFQFIKSKKWPAGEEKALKMLKGKAKLFKGGKGFVGIMGDTLPFSIHKKAAKETLDKAKKAILSKKYDLIVLDEINVALSLKLVSQKDVLKVIKLLPEKSDLILTGRGAPKSLIKIADLVTEFKDVKHPFKKGIIGAKKREY